MNWDIERQVWDHLFGKERLAVSSAFFSVTILASPGINLFIILSYVV